MAQPKQQYKCSECGNITPKWAGQCSSCGKWNTIEEYDAPNIPTQAGKGTGFRASKATTGNSARPVNQISTELKEQQRIATGISEFDRVMGGGLVPSGVTLLAGSPGVGKSSCALAVASAVANQGYNVLYVTGEETAEQVAARAVRIGATDTEGKLGESLYLLAEGNLQNIIGEIARIQPTLFILDSLQTIASSDTESRVGSMTQVTEVATDLTSLAKRLNIPAILIGQITKNDDIAGPKFVEHLVDTVLMFEASDDSPLRLLRVRKSRYSATDEIGCFEHTAEGLVAVEDPSGFFTSQHAPGTTGFATAITMEGIRALPIELQALVTKTKLPNPRKITSGIDHARALQMQAVIDRYIRLNLDSQDVYVSTTGGLRLKDASTDLAVAAAIISSAQDIPIPHTSVFIGEVSLTGEIRPSRERRRRAIEADRLGFTTIYTTPGDKLDVKAKVVELTTVREMAQELKNIKDNMPRTNYDDDYND